MDDEGLGLLKQLVEATEPGHDEPFCAYCGCIEDEPHEPDCLWLKARAYLKDRGVELESVD